ncbi:hypothetical protein CANTEDRAFT_131463, partial [Yamadazyma tenuis ATCC 10573]
LSFPQQSLIARTNRRLKLLTNRQLKLLTNPSLKLRINNQLSLLQFLKRQENHQLLKPNRPRRSSHLLQHLELSNKLRKRHLHHLLQHHQRQYQHPKLQSILLTR